MSNIILRHNRRGLKQSRVAALRVSAYQARMSSLLYVALGGAIGASCRHLFGTLALRVSGSGFAYGTMGVNVLGSFAMGVLVAWLALRGNASENMPENMNENMRLFLGVGVLGGFTTFSAFSLDAIMMFEKKAYGPFVGYVGGSVVLSLIALLCGLVVARKVLAL